MAGVNKEQVVFLAGLALLAWDAVALVRGPGTLPNPPKPPRRAQLEPAKPPAMGGVATAQWNPAGRNPFLPRQEFTDLPPAALPVPPAPAAAVVVGAPVPGASAAAVAAQFRKATGSGKPLDIDTPPATDEEGR